MKYPGDCRTTMADLITVKLLLNSVILTLVSKLMMLDIKKNYLNTPLAEYKYIWIKPNIFPEDVIKEYGLNEKSTKYGWVYIKIKKGLYGLPQAGILA